MVASTSSPHLILGAEELAEVMAARAGRPLLLIDLAVPRDIDPACAELPGVTLYDIDDLQAVVARNLGARGRGARAPRRSSRRRSSASPGGSARSRWCRPLTALRERGDDDRRRGVLAENEGRWEIAVRADRERVEALARAVVQRLLHEPTRAHEGRRRAPPRAAAAAARAVRARRAARGAEAPTRGEVRPLRRRARVLSALRIGTAAARWRWRRRVGGRPARRASARS